MLTIDGFLIGMEQFGQRIQPLMSSRQGIRTFGSPTRSRFRDRSSVPHDALATRNRKFESISSTSESDANLIPWGLRVAAQGAAGPLR